MYYIGYRRTWNITSLPKYWLSFWVIWSVFLPRNHFIIRGFSPWNGERFLSLGQCGEPSWEGGVGIVWLAAWKLVSNDAKRTIPTPNAKHSTLLQGCFFMFLFLISFTIRQQCIIYPHKFSTEPVSTHHPTCRRHVPTLWRYRLTLPPTQEWFYIYVWVCWEGLWWCGDFWGGFGDFVGEKFCHIGKSC